jgi:hypothetical protein
MRCSDWCESDGAWRGGIRFETPNPVKMPIATETTV